MAFMAIIKEANHGNEEESREESRTEETQNVFEVDRQQDIPDVQRPSIQGSASVGEGQTAEGHDQGGREYNRQNGLSGKIIDNWKVDMDLVI